MDSATHEIITGSADNHKMSSKRSLGTQSKVKSGRIDKVKMSGGQTRPREATVKKAVNNYILFRSMMSPVFPNWTQADRSRFIRSMWEKEEHKTTYGLMARVWTFIRDNSNYKNLPQFLAGAGLITRITGPDVWLDLYNMQLVRTPSGEVELMQLVAPAPGAIPPPHNLTDFDLLHDLIHKGLPLERPAQLLQQMSQHSLHIMTVNKKQDFSVLTEDLGESGRAVVGFTQQMNYNPVATFADILSMDPSDSFFDFGVNVIDVEDITSFDRYLVVATDSQTQYRLPWDTTTAHHAQLHDGSIDTAAVEDAAKVWDMNQMNDWNNITGQITQHEYEAEHGETEPLANEFIMPPSFQDQYHQIFDLQ